MKLASFDLRLVHYDDETTDVEFTAASLHFAVQGVINQAEAHPDDHRPIREVISADGRIFDVKQPKKES